MEQSGSVDVPAAFERTRPSPSFIPWCSRIGGRQPTLETILLLCDALGASPGSVVTAVGVLWTPEP